MSVNVNHRGIAIEVRRYLEVATGDCAGEYVGMLQHGEIGSCGVIQEMWSAWKDARASVGRNFDDRGWVADWLFSDPTWVTDLAGDRMMDLVGQSGLKWRDSEFDEAFNAVCDELAKLMRHAKDEILGMKRGAVEEVL